MLNIVIGSHVWVEDKDLSWVDGEVFRIDGQNAHVRTTKGKTVCIAMVTKSAKSYCFVYFLAFQFLVQSLYCVCHRPTPVILLAYYAFFGRKLAPYA
jgi:myosin-5